jgi:Stigma-specific protein, Stig1
MRIAFSNLGRGPAVAVPLGLLGVVACLAGLPAAGGCGNSVTAAGGAAATSSIATVSTGSSTTSTAITAVTSTSAVSSQAASMDDASSSTVTTGGGGAGGAGGSGGGAGPGGGGTGGACPMACMFGRMCCEGQCVTPYNDILNCGTCGKQCPGPHPFCNNGTCTSLPICMLSPGQECNVAGAFCCGTFCCTAGQLCCDVDSPVDMMNPQCSDPVDGTCPQGCPGCP